MKNPSGNTPSRRRPSVKRALLLAAFFVAAGLAVRQGVRLFVPGPPVQPVLPDPGIAKSPSDGEWSATGPSQMASDPLAGSGLVPFDGDPGGIGPPDGAKRRFGFSRVVVGERHEQASYEFAGPSDAAAEHYLRVLREAGYAISADGIAISGSENALQVHNESDMDGDVTYAQIESSVWGT